MDDAQPPQAQAQQQEVAPPSMPVASGPSKPDAPRGPALPPAPAGIGYLATLGVGVGILRTDLSGGQEGTTAAGGFLHLGASGFSESISYSGRLTALLGGGSGGMESLIVARAYVGGGPVVSDHSQVFFRFGAETTSLKNDEIEASLTSLPAVQIGYQIWARDVGFEIAPRIGLSPRTEYEPGDESLGRRHWRRLGVRASGGGSLFVTAGKMFALDASYTRVVDEDPLDLVDGRLCLTPFYVGVCGVGQYWRSIATLPIGGAAAQEIPTMYVGVSLGVGITGEGRDKVF